jgi:hypothetical protein
MYTVEGAGVFRERVVADCEAPSKAPCRGLVQVGRGSIVGLVSGVGGR